MSEQLTILDLSEARAAIATERRSIEDPSVPISYIELAELLGGGMKAAGVTVSAETAMRLSAAYACTNVLSQIVAASPAKVFERLKSGGRREATDHSVHWIVHEEPNPLMSPLTAVEADQASVSLRGNGVGKLLLDGAGRVTGWWPWSPDRVRIVQRDDTVRYYHRSDSGEVEVYDSDEVVHVAGLGNGVVGWSVIANAREAMGGALATQSFANAFWENGSFFGGFVKHEKVMSDAARDRLLKQIASKFKGSSNAGKLMLLEEGTEYQGVTMPLKDAQFLELIQAQAVDICRFFNMPPYMIGAKSGDPLTYKTVEQELIKFVTMTVRPQVIRREQEWNRKLFSKKDRGRFFVEFNLDAVVRGDLLSQYQAFAMAVNGGWLSRNEVRATINRNPEPGLDEFAAPKGATPADPNPDDSPDPTDDPDTTASRRDLKMAFAGLIQDAHARCARREAKALESAWPKIQRGGVKAFESWAETFYVGHRSYIEAAYAPVISAARTFVGVPDSGEGEARAIADRYIEASKAALCEAIAGPDGLSAWRGWSERYDLSWERGRIAASVVEEAA